MMPEAHGLALHFQVPAVLHSLAAQFAVGVDLPAAFGAPQVLHPLAAGVKQFDERFEGPADATERGNALLVQLALETGVTISCPPAAHTIILPRGHVPISKRQRFWQYSHASPEPERRTVIDSTNAEKIFD